MKYFLIIFLGLVIISCGKDGIVPEDHTRIILGQENSNKSIQANYGFNGGIIVQAINTDLKRKMVGSWANLNQFNSGPKTVYLPNGHYKFIAIAYDDATAGKTFNATDFYCEEYMGAEGVTLNGGSVVINMLLSKSSADGKCRSPMINFSSHFDAQHATDLQKIGFRVLNNVDPTTSNISFTTPQDIELVLEPKEMFQNNINPGSLKRCMSEITYWNSGSSSLRIPASPHFPLRVNIFSSGDGSCTGIIRSYLFENLDDIPTEVTNPPTTSVGPVVAIKNGTSSYRTIYLRN